MAFLFPPPKKKTPRIIAIPNPSDAILDPIYYCLPEWVPLAVLRPSTSDPSLNPTPPSCHMALWPQLRNEFVAFRSPYSSPFMHCRNFITNLT